MTSPRSHLDDERRHFDQFYRDEGPRILASPLYRLIDQRMAELIARNGCVGADRVLSLGSGDGRIEMLLAPRVHQIVGIELSQVGVDLAREQAVQAGLANVSYEVGDIETVDLPPGSFDAIWAVAVLHHMDAGAIRNLLRRSLDVLRSGGRFLSIDPSSRRLVARLRWLAQKTYARHHTADERELDFSLLRDLLEEVGFVDVRTVPSDFFVSPLAWVFPGFPGFLAHPAVALDTLLMRLPVVRGGASSFCMVATRP
jgi:SAM-dependent methyltransferase